MDLLELAHEVSQLVFHNNYDARMQMTATQARQGVHEMYGPLVRWAAAEIAVTRRQDVLNVMVNRLPAGVYVDKHVDPLMGTKHQPHLPRVERWHLPIITDPDCLLNGEHLELGFWHGPVRYWEPHDVRGGARDRVHLLVDLDTPWRVE